MLFEATVCRRSWVRTPTGARDRMSFSSEQVTATFSLIIWFWMNSQYNRPFQILNLFRTLSSSGSINYRPSAPLFYEVASHVKNCHSGQFFFCHAHHGTGPGHSHSQAYPWYLLIGITVLTGWMTPPSRPREKFPRAFSITGSKFVGLRKLWTSNAVIIRGTRDMIWKSTSLGQGGYHFAERAPPGEYERESWRLTAKLLVSIVTQVKHINPFDLSLFHLLA